LVESKNVDTQNQKKKLFTVISFDFDKQEYEVKSEEY